MNMCRRLPISCYPASTSTTGVINRLTLGVFCTGNTPDHLDADKKVGPERTISHHLDPALDKSRHYVFEVLFDYGDLPPLLPVYEESIPDTPWWDRSHDDLSAVGTASRSLLDVPVLF